MPHAREQSRIPSLRWLLLYLVCFVGSSIVVQLDPDAKPPWVDGSPIEYFTGSLLWSSSILSLIISGTRSAARRVTWLAISAGLAVLAIDEMFLLHEHLANIVGDDDHYKLVQWITTGFALWYLRKMENAPAETNWSFLIGYLIHTVYVAVDFGDGDYYTIGFASIEVLGWVEEYLELLALAAYFIGVLYLHTRSIRAFDVDDQVHSV